MLCNQCGKIIADDAVYCAWCGATVANTAPAQAKGETARLAAIGQGTGKTASGAARHATTQGVKTKDQFEYRSVRQINTQPPSRKAPAIFGGIVAAALVVSGIATNGFGLLNEPESSGGSSASTMQIVPGQSESASATSTSSTTSSTSSTTTSQSATSASASATSGTAASGTAAASGSATSAASASTSATSAASTTQTTTPPAAGESPIAPHETTIAEPTPVVSNYSDDDPTSPFWLVQVGAFKERANAERALSNLRTKGYSAHILVSSEWTDLNQDNWYVVTAGVYGSRSEAEGALSGVRSSGYSSAFVRYSGSLK